MHQALLCVGVWSGSRDLVVSSVSQHKLDVKAGLKFRYSVDGFAPQGGQSSCGHGGCSVDKTTECVGQGQGTGSGGGSEPQLQPSPQSQCLSMILELNDQQACHSRAEADITCVSDRSIAPDPTLYLTLPTQGPYQSTIHRIAPPPTPSHCPPRPFWRLLPST